MFGMCVTLVRPDWHENDEIRVGLLLDKDQKTDFIIFGVMNSPLPVQN
jgi:hypothetical protein